MSSICRLFRGFLLRCGLYDNESRNAERVNQSTLYSRGKRLPEMTLRATFFSSFFLIYAYASSLYFKIIHFIIFRLNMVQVHKNCDYSRDFILPFLPPHKIICIKIGIYFPNFVYFGDFFPKCKGKGGFPKSQIKPLLLINKYYLLIISDGLTQRVHRKVFLCNKPVYASFGWYRSYIQLYGKFTALTCLAAGDNK